MHGGLVRTILYSLGREPAYREGGIYPTIPTMATLPLAISSGMPPGGTGVGPLPRPEGAPTAQFSKAGSPDFSRSYSAISDVTQRLKPAPQGQASRTW